jgi:hypothetical protein
MNSENVLAFLVMALNPRRPYDEDYKGFVHLLTQQLTTPQLSAVILREEVEQRQKLQRQEALDRERLYKELSESESKFARFATRAPIGLAILRPDGTALSANGKLLHSSSTADCKSSVATKAQMRKAYVKQTFIPLQYPLNSETIVVADGSMQNFGET